MINKKNLWFLTLTSIILVLAIYYVTMPLGNDNMVLNSNNNNNTEKEVMVNIEESEALTAARIEKQEQDLNEVKKLQEILLSEDKTIDEKNEAYERIKLMYGTMKGVTTYPAEDGKYYIVQSKVIAKL